MNDAEKEFDEAIAFVVKFNLPTKDLAKLIHKLGREGKLEENMVESLGCIATLVSMIKEQGKSMADSVVALGQASERIQGLKKDLSSKRVYLFPENMIANIPQEVIDKYKTPEVS